MQPEIVIVAAVAANGVIGRSENAHLGMPWHLPEDLRYFKQLTLGHAIVMGRKTWQSIGRALPQRRNLVVSRDPGFVAPGAETFVSLAAALQACAAETTLFVIGGAQIFAQALPLADRMELTEIRQAFSGDTLFPAWSPDDWQESRRTAQLSASGLAFDFVTYQRKSKA